MKIKENIGNPINNAKELLYIYKNLNYLIDNSYRSLFALHCSPFIITFNIKDYENKKQICNALERYDKSYPKKDLFYLIPIWLLNESIREASPSLLTNNKLNMEVLCFYLLYSIKLDNLRIDENGYFLSQYLKDYPYNNKIFVPDIENILSYIEINSFLNIEKDKLKVKEHIRRLIDIRYNKLFNLIK